ncbi:MAG: vWA domain-containing protein, partial [Alphaproteobacteria bacterium]
GIAIPAVIETVGPAALARASTPDELKALCTRLNYEMGGAGAGSARGGADRLTEAAPTSPRGLRAEPPAPPPPPVALPAPLPSRPADDAAAARGGGSFAAPPSARLEAPRPPVAAPPPPSRALSPPRDGRISDFVPSQGRQADAGLLTAGDYDDVLNPKAYAEYVRKYIGQRGNTQRPYVNTEGQLKVSVVDRAGRPIPFAKVSARRTDGSSVELTTVADGSVVFFPDVDNLPQDVDLNVAAPGAAGIVHSRVAGLSQTIARKVTVTAPGTARPVHALDLLLVLDTTGSMGDELKYLQTELRSIVAKVADGHPGLQVRVGLVVYRDIGDQYVLRSFPFTSDVSVLQKQLAAQSAGGGGDEPEAMEQAIGKILDYPWREDAVRVALLVADAPPHNDKLPEAWKLALLARQEHIQITSVAASGINPSAEFLMRGMAAVTQTRYLFLTDDSGVGNAHAEPSVACYQVTRLDGLVERVLSSLVSGRRVEPAPEQIIRTVGDYDRGVCRIPDGYDKQQGQVAPGQKR